MIDSRLPARQQAEIRELDLDWRNAYVGLQAEKLVAFPAQHAAAVGATALRVQTLAAVRAPLESLRALPSHRSELLSESRGGEFLDLLQSEGDWALVQGEDGYVGWLARWTLEEQSEAARADLLARWCGRFRAPHGTLWNSDHWASAPLWRGTPFLTPQDDGIRERSGERRVQLPWAAEGWVSQLEIEGGPQGSAEDALRVATQLLGTPYRWGGRAGAGLDCSGYTQYCWLMAGVALSRDAAQQAHDGQAVAVEDRSQWRAGDLLCFGSPADHIGLSDGRDGLLHARGWVRRQPLKDLDPLLARLSAVRRPRPKTGSPATLWLRPAGERNLPL